MPETWRVVIVREVLLATEAIARPRNRCQALRGNGLLAFFADAVFSALEAFQRSINGLYLFVGEVIVPNRDKLLMENRCLILECHGAAVQNFQTAPELRLNPRFLRNQQFRILLRSVACRP